ncbi:hypothetical protein QUF72_02485 [Desulfobacterales bacterium HSG2]|nr:hypothetical protein [Desulfobacterales bacterium HSG2]
MKIEIRNGLAYTSVSLTYEGRQITLDNILLDTGSAGTIFSADKILDRGLHIEVYDRMHRIQGTEFVFTKRIDRLCLGELQVSDFDIQVGAMNYGIDMNGIIDLNFLLQVGAHIDLKRLEIY